MAFPCSFHNCQQVFDDEMEMIIHLTGGHEQAEDFGASCETCGEYVTSMDIVTHSNSHIKNQESPSVAPVSFAVSCMLDHMNQTQKIKNNDVLGTYINLLFDGCVFQRGGNRGFNTLPKTLIRQIRLDLLNRTGPSNTKITDAMQKIWINSGEYEGVVDTLYRPKANPVARGTGPVNLLQMCLYIILTQIHRRNNVKKDLFKRPEDFPIELSETIRERLSCLSRYIQAGMYTVFPTDTSSPVPGILGECMICYRDEVMLLFPQCSNVAHVACKQCTMTHCVNTLSNGDKTIYDVPCIYRHDHVMTNSHLVQWSMGPFSALERMQKSQETTLLTTVSIIDCPNAQCDFVFASDPVDSTKKLECPKCRVSICTFCYMLEHASYGTPVCDRFMVSKHALLMEQGFTMCPKCETAVERHDDNMSACLHMTCKLCTHEYCWRCLVDWEKHDGYYYRCDDKDNGHPYFYNDSIRRYFPNNPLSTFDTLDFSDLPHVYSKTIDRFRRGNEEMKDTLITNGDTLCPDCYQPVLEKKPTDPGGLRTTCMFCNHMFCWECLRPVNDHIYWDVTQERQTTCSMEKLPLYTQLYEAFNRRVYPGTSDMVVFSSVQHPYQQLN